MYHYPTVDNFQTPPRNHLESNIPIKGNHEIKIDDYRKSLSPFQMTFGSNIKPENPQQNQQNKEIVRKTLQEKFKNVFNSPLGKPFSRSNSVCQMVRPKSNADQVVEKLSPNNQRKYSEKQVQSVEPTQKQEKIEPVQTVKNTEQQTFETPKQYERKKSSASCSSKQCSECSGSAKKGMEYICIQCLNKEMSTEKKTKTSYGKRNRKNT